MNLNWRKCAKVSRKFIGPLKKDMGGEALLGRVLLVKRDFVIWSAEAVGDFSSPICLRDW